MYSDSSSKSCQPVKNKDTSCKQIPTTLGPRTFLKKLQVNKKTRAIIRRLQTQEPLTKSRMRHHCRGMTYSCLTSYSMSTPWSVHDRMKAMLMSRLSTAPRLSRQDQHSATSSLAHSARGSREYRAALRVNNFIVVLMSNMEHKSLAPNRACGKDVLHDALLSIIISKTGQSH